MAGESYYPTRLDWEVCRILLVRILITSFQIEKICAMDQGYSNALTISELYYDLDNSIEVIVDEKGRGPNQLSRI